LTTLPPKCADCLEILEPQPPVTLRACLRIVLPLPLPQSLCHDIHFSTFTYRFIRWWWWWWWW